MNYDVRKSAKPSDRNIEIGWGLNIDESSSAISNNLNLGNEEYLDSVGVKFSFDIQDGAIDRESQELQPSFLTSEICGSFKVGDDVDHTLNIALSRASGRGRKLEYDSSMMGDSTLSRLRVSDLDGETRKQAERSLSRAQVVSFNTRHFLPTSPIVRFDRNLTTSTAIADELSGERPRRNVRALNIPTSDDLRLILERAIDLSFQSQTRLTEVKAQIFGDSEISDVTIDNISRRIWALPLSTRRSVMSALSKDRKKIRDEIFRTMGAEQTIRLVRVPRVMEVTQANELFFRFSIRYLGPLRADPKPLHPLQALKSSTDVGQKGEMTAAVLHLNRKRLVSTISPASFLDPRSEKIMQNKPLSEAVSDWLNYLDVAQEVEIFESPFGNSRMSISS